MTGYASIWAEVDPGGDADVRVARIAGDATRRVNEALARHLGRGRPAPARHPGRGHVARPGPGDRPGRSGPECLAARRRDRPADDRLAPGARPGADAQRADHQRLRACPRPGRPAEARPDHPPAIAFVDLSGYTTMTVERGDEAAAAAADRLRAIAEECVRGVDGRLVKLLGDGVLLLFQDRSSALTRDPRARPPGRRRGPAAGPRRDRRRPRHRPRRRRLRPDGQPRLADRRPGRARPGRRRGRGRDRPATRGRRVRSDRSGRAQGPPDAGRALAGEGLPERAVTRAAAGASLRSARAGLPPGAGAWLRCASTPVTLNRGTARRRSCPSRRSRSGSGRRPYRRPSPRPSSRARGAAPDGPELLTGNGEREVLEAGSRVSSSGPAAGTRRDDLGPRLGRAEPASMPLGLLRLAADDAWRPRDVPPDPPPRAPRPRRSRPWRPRAAGSVAPAPGRTEITIDAKTWPGILPRSPRVLRRRSRPVPVRAEPGSVRRACSTRGPVRSDRRATTGSRAGGRGGSTLGCIARSRVLAARAVPSAVTGHFDVSGRRRVHATGRAACGRRLPARGSRRGQRPVVPRAVRRHRLAGAPRAGGPPHRPCRRRSSIAASSFPPPGSRPRPAAASGCRR